MSAMKKERTPEQIEAAKARMAAVRANRGMKPQVPEISPQIEPKKLTRVEHKRAASVPNEFEGISAKDCCDSCYTSKGARCAITHRGLCGHPMKGGLQQPDQMRLDTVARYQRAKKILAHAKIEAA